ASGQEGTVRGEGERIDAVAVPLEHAIGLEARNRPEAHAGVLTSAGQPLAVFGKCDGLGVSPVGVYDNRLSGCRGGWPLHLSSLLLHSLPFPSSNSFARSTTSKSAAQRRRSAFRSISMFSGSSSS